MRGSVGAGLGTWESLAGSVRCPGAWYCVCSTPHRNVRYVEQPTGLQSERGRCQGCAMTASSARADESRHVRAGALWAQAQARASAELHAAPRQRARNRWVQRLWAVAAQAQQAATPRSPLRTLVVSFPPFLRHCHCHRHHHLMALVARSRILRYSGMNSLNVSTLPCSRTSGTSGHTCTMYDYRILQ